MYLLFPVLTLACVPSAKAVLVGGIFMNGKPCVTIYPSIFSCVYVWMYGCKYLCMYVSIYLPIYASYHPPSFKYVYIRMDVRLHVYRYK